jgi:Zn-dependent M28 family amino/carboxypeptidase
MQGREFGTAGGARARAFLVDRFRTAGLVPIGESYEWPVTAVIDGTTRRGANLIGVVRGTRHPDRYIVLSAHYDHVGVRNGEVFNGADDNASGAAALAVIAGVVASHPLDSSLLVVAFDGEEENLIGSRAFVRHPPVDSSALLIDLNMDMIGRDARNRLFVVGTARQPGLKSLVDDLRPTVPVDLRAGHESGPPGEEDWTRDSDHYAFMEAGIPALYFGVEDYAQLHRPTDDYETMTYGFYVRAVETMIAAVRWCDTRADELSKARRSPARGPSS